MRDGIRRLRQRWEEYDRKFRERHPDNVSAETVIAAYTDWADAMGGAVQDEFDARQGGHLLRGIGINTHE